MLSLAISSYSYSLSASSSSSGISPVVWAIYGIIAVIVIASQWKVFTKAGEKGWKAIIPFYSSYISLKISGKPGWWLVMFFVPFANIYFLVAAIHALSKSFGKDIGTTLMLIFLPFIGYPVLGFGSAKYVGPGGVAMSTPVPQQPAPTMQPPAVPTV